MGLWASEKEVLFSLNPLLAFTHSQDLLQRGDGKQLCFHLDQRWHQRGVGMSMGHCHLWRTGRGRGEGVKRLVPGLAHTVMTILKSNAQ